MKNFDTSEYKVTYLLGAGASANSLPTVKATESTKGLSESLKDFANEISNTENLNPYYKNYTDKLIKNLIWLSEESLKYGTVDTYAKFLYLLDRKRLDDLKEALSVYFTHEQLIKNKFDIRALVFLTTVMENGGVFPTNIKILTWNYDYQIQMAAETFRQERFTYSGGSVHSPPLIPYYPSLGNEMIVNHNDRSDSDFSMVHLNGLAGFYFYEQTAHILSNFLNQKPSDINQLVEKIHTDMDRKHNLLTFAWETETTASYYLRNRVELAKSIIKDSNILVIIGYSFPFFNRRVDSAIMETFKEANNLTKIYYQDPYRSGDFLRKQFGLSDDIEIVHISDKNNYFVPNEL